ncbi:helix-turn-helix transcriptional regulator [Vibrio agarivorans]|uniref:helix-turn-helix transcriptional regulator n=1 Tax=Vibrio agarivorans TaxID=153622 RepID=UPI0025B43F06|nr:AlpA family transcriptional regulator [Vibrio agarivorans]MDN3660456.1 AlpA family transcriptional regulator [Vibrio agarivorans]
MKAKTIEQFPVTSRLMRVKEIIRITGLSRSSLYKCISEGQFPKAVSLSERSVAWVEEEVQDWITAKIQQRNLNIVA